MSHLIEINGGCIARAKLARTQVGLPETGKAFVDDVALYDTVACVPSL